MATLDQVSTNNSINIFFFQNLTEKVRNQGMSIFNQRNYLIFSPIFFISEMYLEISHKIVNRSKKFDFSFFSVKTLTSKKIIKCLVSSRAKNKNIHDQVFTTFFETYPFTFWNFLSFEGTKLLDKIIANNYGSLRSYGTVFYIGIVTTYMFYKKCSSCVKILDSWILIVTKNQT